MVDLIFYLASTYNSYIYIYIYIYIWVDPRFWRVDAEAEARKRIGKAEIWTASTSELAYKADASPGDHDASTRLSMLAPSLSSKLFYTLIVEMVLLGAFINDVTQILTTFHPLPPPPSSVTHLCTKPFALLSGNALPPLCSRLWMLPRGHPTMTSFGRYTVCAILQMTKKRPKVWLIFDHTKHTEHSHK